MTGSAPGGRPDGAPGGLAHGAGGGRRAGPVLPLVPFGRTSLRVTRLVFGGAPIGGLFAACDALSLPLYFLPFTARLSPFNANWLPLNGSSIGHRPFPLRSGGHLWYRFEED